MAEIDNTAEELFFKLRNRFPRISMGDENGQITVDPAAGRFFNFDYEHENEKYGKITCSLIDTVSLKIYFSQDITEKMDELVAKHWFSFLRELRRFAKVNMLTFDVRDISKDALSQEDIVFASKRYKSKSSMTESKIHWSRRGLFSEGNHKSIKIHVVHKNKMQENLHNRLVQVDKIYLVKDNQEKFLLPFTSITGAKAMANHVARNGTPYDEGGLAISKAIAEMKNLQRFATVTRNKKFESNNPYKVIDATRYVKEELRKHLKRMAGGRFFEESLNAVLTLTKANDHRTSTELKDWFVEKYYNENIDTYLDSAARAYHKYEEHEMSTLKEAATSVAQKILDPNYKLILKADDSMDNMIRNGKYTTQMALVTQALMDIGDRLITPDGDDLANFAAMMSDKISSEGEAFGQRPDEEYKQQKALAVKLAAKYIGDMNNMQADPAYKDSVRKDPTATMGGKKDRKGKVKTAAETFEDEIMAIGETPESIDRNEKEIQKIIKKLHNRGYGFSRSDIGQDPEKTRRLAQGIKTLLDRGHSWQNAEVLANREIPESIRETAYEADIKDSDPVRVHGFKGHDSRPFKKRFSSYSKFMTWADTAEADDYSITHVEKDQDWTKMSKRSDKLTGLDEVANRDAAHRFRSIKKSHRKLGEEPNEGNEFSGALAKAKAAGAKTFKVGSKSYDVKESMRKSPKFAQMVPKSEKDGKPMERGERVIYQKPVDPNKMDRIGKKIGANKGMDEADNRSVSLKSLTESFKIGDVVSFRHESWGRPAGSWKKSNVSAVYRGYIEIDEVDNGKPIKFNLKTGKEVGTTSVGYVLKNVGKLTQMSSGIEEGYTLKKTYLGKQSDDETGVKSKNTDYDIIHNKSGKSVGTASHRSDDHFGPGSMEINMKNGATRSLDLKGRDPQSAFNQFAKNLKTSKKYKSVEEGKWDYPKDLTKNRETSDMGTTNASANREARKALRKKVKAKAHKELMKGSTAATKSAKPDFLDVDKDGNKTEPMKKALNDKAKNIQENELRFLAGLPLVEQKNG
jgi:hypothetical protein